LALRGASRANSFTLEKIAPGTHWMKGWVGPRAGLGAVNRKVHILLPRIEPRLKSVGCTDCAIPAQRLRLRCTDCAIPAQRLRPRCTDCAIPVQRLRPRTDCAIPAQRLRPRTDCAIPAQRLRPRCTDCAIPAQRLRPRTDCATLLNT
jgi:hypothetical protein